MDVIHIDWYNFKAFVETIETEEENVVKRECFLIELLPLAMECDQDISGAAEALNHLSFFWENLW